MSQPKETLQIGGDDTENLPKLRNVYGQFST